MKKTSDKYEEIEWNAFVSRLHKPIKCKPKKYYDSKKIFKKHSPPPKKKKTPKKTKNKIDFSGSLFFELIFTFTQSEKPKTNFLVYRSLHDF